MRRATLEKLIAARREGRVLVRAVHLTSGEERLLDPACDLSPLGLAAAAAAREDFSHRVALDDGEWFLTVYNTPWEIVISGAVHIAQALAALAIPAGYRVRVIDPRAPYATEERFAGLKLERAWPDEVLAHRPLTARSALVALAHDPKLDDAALTAALRSPAFYIGALGSARTHARRLERLAGRGFSPGDLAKIHGPVGLPIGARAPAEIAIAILAELVKLRRRKPVKHIAGIVLAAGTSSRMGRNKLVEPVKGKPLVRHAVDAALASRLDPIVVVSGHEADRIASALNDAPVTLIHNKDYAGGLSSSLKAGIAAVPEDCEGAMVLLGDMPSVTPALIDRLVAAFDPAMDRAICVALGHGHPGHPVLWARRFFPEIAALRGDQGARSLLRVHAGEIAEIEAGDDSPLIDIDTQQALASYQG
ncbi:MAG TPA: NTP transferase domain-containing protein [Rhizomicrobium sp.]|nr:NTP transferase domain-containing protein [Rhizomicrobium sp.]